MNFYTDMFLIAASPFVGSFVITLAHRLPAGFPMAIARSGCLSCGTRLMPTSLVPVVSWIVQRGRCRHCHAEISPVYPLVETAALVIAIWSIMIVSGWLFAATCVLGWTLLALSLIDGRSFILPDVLTLPLLAGGLAITFAIDPGELPDRLAAAVIAFVVFSTIAFLYRRIRGREGLGLGDAKLFAAGGSWVGLAGLPGIILIACFAVLAWTLIRGAVQRKLSTDEPIAFGPFLALGIWTVWLYGPLELGW